MLATLVAPLLVGLLTPSVARTRAVHHHHPQHPHQHCTPGPCRVLVRNVAFEATENSLTKKLAAEFGPVEAVELAACSRKSRHHARPHGGWAYATFHSEVDAMRASASNFAVQLQGRALSIRLADVHRSPRKEQQAQPQGRTRTKGSSSEQSAELERRADLLETLSRASCAQEVDECVGALGQLQSKEEYAVASAALERVASTPTPRPGLRRSGFSI